LFLSFKKLLGALCLAISQADKFRSNQSGSAADENTLHRVDAFTDTLYGVKR